MKASITYNAQGEAKVLEWQGYTFFDGKSTDVYDPAVIEAAKSNRFFKVNHIDEKAEKPEAPKPEDHDEAPSHEGRAQRK